MKDMFKDKKIIALLAVVVVILGVIFILPSFSGNSNVPKENPVEDFGIKTYEDYTAFVESSQLLYPKKNDTFRYNVYSNYIEISEYIGTAADVVVPSQIDDYPVLIIGSKAFVDKPVTNITVEKGIMCVSQEAFLENTNIKKIAFDEGLLFIEDKAFCGCSGLESITIKNGIFSIGTSAFEDCTSLKEFPIIDSIQTYGVACFKGCSSLVSITVSPVYKIPSSFCSECENLSTVTIKELPKIEEKNTNKTTEEVQDRVIESGAFGSCPALVSIWMPNDITEIDENILGQITEEKRASLTISGYSSSQAALFAAQNKIDFILLDIEEFEKSSLIIKDLRNQLNTIVLKYLKQPIVNGNNKDPYIPYSDSEAFFTEVKTLSDKFLADGKITSYNYSNDLYTANLKTGQIFTFNLNVSVVLEENEITEKTPEKSKNNASTKTNKDQTNTAKEEASNA